MAREVARIDCSCAAAQEGLHALDELRGEQRQDQQYGGDEQQPEADAHARFTTQR